MAVTVSVSGVGAEPPAGSLAVAPGQPLPEDDEVYVSWLDTFQQELAAVQTVHDAAPRLKAEDLRAAVSTAERLLSVLDEAQANVRAKQARAAGEAEPPAGGVDAGAQDT